MLYSCSTFEQGEERKLTWKLNSEGDDRHGVLQFPN